MGQILAATASMVVAFVFLVAFASHLVKPHLASAIRHHGLIPMSAAGAVALVVIILEGLLGLLAVAVSVGVVRASGAMVAAAASLTFFGSLMLYQAMVLRRITSPVPCGCGLGDGEVGRVSLVRCGVLALCSLGLVRAGSVTDDVLIDQILVVVPGMVASLMVVEGFALVEFLDAGREGAHERPG